MKNPVYTYNFKTSNPLTQRQIEWLNEQLLENLPSENEDLQDIPEWVSVILLDDVEELID